MANPQHIQWLKEGVSAWNKRRESATFKPDLSSHDFGGRTLFETNRGRERDHWERVPLRGIDLRDANLAHADLRVVDLSEASLYYANLTGASLSQAILVGTDLRFANLTDANFVNADLTSAKFGGYGAKLTNANLQAPVTDADFREADLTDAGWLPGELWKAKLFWPHRSPWQYPHEPAAIETVSDLLKTINDIRQYHGSQTEAHEPVFLYFRGEPKCGWDLRPSVMRDHLRAHESDMLRDVIARRPGEFSGTSSALDRWVTAQHHGLRTRFLDITRNPLVALFHACADLTAEVGRLHVFAVPQSLIKPYDSDIISIIANL
ncbi:MAG: FRG domain-containing protein, partial [Gemmatimonadetes bacterium]|nr:FRG domain-containing protein [Gemmatimonadota bacterium]